MLPTDESFIGARSNHLGGASIVLHKHAANGELLWTAAFEHADFTNAEPSSMALDGEGNIHLVGLSRQPYINAASAVLKYSHQGQLLWSHILNGTNLWGSVHAFAVDPQGNSAIAVLGSSMTTVTRYNHAGDLQWSFVEASPDNDTIAVAVNASGDTYLGTTIRVGGDNEIRLRKLDSTGALVWTRAYAEGQHFNRPHASWQYGLAVGADAIGEIRVLATESPGSDSDADFSLLRYRQRDPASSFRLQLIPNAAAGTFHLGVPTQEPFRIEASVDLRTWSMLSEEETERLLQPGATSCADPPKRFFGLILAE